MTITAIYRPTFDLTPRVVRVPDGTTLAGIVARMPGLPPEFTARGVICLNGHEVPRALWHAVRPKPGHNGGPVSVTLHLPPRDGGDDGGKSVFALVASIALTALTGFIGAGGLATRFGLTAFAQGTFAAQALATGVSLVGSLLISALIPPPRGNDGASARLRNEGSASAEGNVLDPNGPVPRVIGERKIFPPLAAEPFTYFDGPDEVVEAVFALAGPHRLTDIRIGAAPVADIPGIEIETREGWPGDPRLDLLRRQSRTEVVQSELTGHSVADDNGARLDNSVDVSVALPQPVILATRDSPDEQILQIVFAQGLHFRGDETVRMRVPIRLRIRRRGDADWRNLPELHFQAGNLRQLRASIRIVWNTDVITPSAANFEGWVEARHTAPGQTVAPETAGWVADSYFAGTGDAWMIAGNLGSTGVRQVDLSRFDARITLDPAEFTPGRYDVEIMRGAAINAADYSASAYTVGGSVWDLFGYRTPSAPEIVRSRDGIADTLVLLRSVSVWDAHPVPTSDFALIAVRARNKALDRVSVVAGGYVPDWDGTAWTGAVVADNPAPHLRDIYAGALNRDPVPLELIDDATLVEWRAHCATQGYRCNALAEGVSVDQISDIVAACGYARPYRSDVWGVVMDRDRSAEVPVQVFTPRNTRGFSWRRAFPRQPDGFRVTWRDEDSDFDARQVTVFRPGVSRDSGLLEQVTYEGFVTEAEVTARAAYDLKQADLRGTFYSLEAPAEAIVCRRGSLVAVEHDSLSTHMGSARVTDFRLDGAGLVDRLALDADVPVLAEPGFGAITDMRGVANMGLIGARTSVMVRRATGAITLHPVAGATGSSDLLTLDPPISRDGIDADTLVSVGLSGREVLRLIVFGIDARPDYRAQLTLIDEAPELFA